MPRIDARVDLFSYFLCTADPDFRHTQRVKDPDLLFPADGVTALALALEIEMLTNDAARARYEAIYGRPWQPLDVSSTGRTVSQSTVSKTVR